MYGIIYCATNLSNGKKYIGQTINFEQRKYRHRRDSELRQDHFHRAILKEGWDNFCWEIIDQAYDKDSLDRKEIYWVDFYHTFTDRERGYNLTPGGEGGDTFSYHPDKERIRQINSESKKGEKGYWFGKEGPTKGRPHTEEEKKKISESQKGDKHYMFGKHLSEENKHKQSEAHKGERGYWFGKKGGEHSTAKAVICIETGIRFLSIEEANKNTGIKRHIGDCCNSIRKTAGGYHWRYADV
jgi:group I intron endonuclease